MSMINDFSELLKCCCSYLDHW